MINSLVNHPKISLHTWATAQQAREKESEVLVTQSCLTLCNPIDCSSPGSSVHGISQARMLKWVAISSSRGSSRPRDQIRIPHLAGRFFTAEPLGRPHETAYSHLNINMSRQGNYGRNILSMFRFMSLSRRR